MEEQKIQEKYMKEAIRQAKKAGEAGDVPIGCVIVYEGKIIARGYNKRNQQKSALGHAEISAIRKASKKLGDWRLEECTMYVTLEPCPMCAGAIVQARIPEVVVGAMNPKAGCAGSIINLLQMQQLNHQVRLQTGILEEDCQKLLKDFFKELRRQQKLKKEKPAGGRGRTTSQRRATQRGTRNRSGSRRDTRSPPAESPGTGVRTRRKTASGTPEGARAAPRPGAPPTSRWCSQQGPSPADHEA